MTQLLRSAYRAVTRFLKLSYLWVARILLAPDHFGVGLASRFKWALCGGYMPDQVHLYRLDEGNAGKYLSEFDWYRSRAIDAPYDVALNNKVLCAQMMAPYASVPAVAYFTEKGHIVRAGHADGYATAEEVLGWIRGARRAFIKPIASGKGKGVHELGYDGERYLIDHAPSSEASVRSLLSGKDWHICAYAEQSAFLNGIFPNVANTLRALTLRDPASGTYRLCFAVLRIGTSSTVPVDNGSKGGLVSRVDLETGELSWARSIQSDERWDTHPDTGARIQGTRIPCWGKVSRDLVLLAEKFPFLEFIAWDILLTDDGFTVIEANASSGVNIIQIWGGQRQGFLGDFYRAHGVIRR